MSIDTPKQTSREADTKQRMWWCWPGVFLHQSFRQRHWKPRFNDAHVPSAYAWQLITPSGERLLIFFEDMDYRELYDDEETHDDELQAQLESTFLANMASYVKALSVKFGPPFEVGPDEHKSIPINGVVRHAIWTVGKKRLYLAVSHEDTELPWVTYLGVTV